MFPWISNGPHTCVRGRVKETGGEKERERETNSDRYKHIDTETHRLQPSDPGTDGREDETHNRQTDKQTDSQPARQAGRQTGRQARIRAYAHTRMHACMHKPLSYTHLCTHLHIANLHVRIRRTSMHESMRASISLLLNWHQHSCMHWHAHRHPFVICACIPLYNIIIQAYVHTFMQADAHRRKHTVANMLAWSICYILFFRIISHQPQKTSNVPALTYNWWL